jgi:hypothetical protein
MTFKGKMKKFLIGVLMKKSVKIALISAAVVVVTAGILFVCIPLVTSKQAETKLRETLAEAEIPEEMWSVNRVYYIPLFRHFVVEELEYKENASFILKAKKVTLTLDKNSEEIFAGSMVAHAITFLDDNYSSITVKRFSLNDFSIDKTPSAALTKLGNIRLNKTVFEHKETTYLSLGRFDIDVDYDKRYTYSYARPSFYSILSFPKSVLLKELIIDEQFISLPESRPKYRFSNIAFVNSFSYKSGIVNLIIDGVNLFKINAVFDISFPSDYPGFFFNIGEAELNSLSLTYNDKSFLDHFLQLVGISGDRADIVEQLNEPLQTIAMMCGFDTEIFADEAVKFIANPEKLELKTNFDSPMSFEGIIQNPSSAKISLSINGGKPFSASRH